MNTEQAALKIAEEARRGASDADDMVSLAGPFAILVPVESPTIRLAFHLLACQ